MKTHFVCLIHAGKLLLVNTSRRNWMKQSGFDLNSQAVLVWAQQLTRNGHVEAHRGARRGQVGHPSKLVASRAWLPSCRHLTNANLVAPRHRRMAGDSHTTAKIERPKGDRNCNTAKKTCRHSCCPSRKPSARWVGISGHIGCTPLKPSHGGVRCSARCEGTITAASW